MPKRYRLQEVAEIYGISTTTVRRWIAEGIGKTKLISFKIGDRIFIAAEDLAKFEKHFRKKTK